MEIILNPGTNLASMMTVYIFSAMVIKLIGFLIKKNIVFLGCWKSSILRLKKPLLEFPNYL
jgi:hypothetical protein